MDKDLQEPSIIKNKCYSESPVFLPQNLLRESRRQNKIPECDVPSICILDPDGDLVKWLKGKGMAGKNRCWGCYHSELYCFELDNREVGIIPCVVGASYAVLVAEQLFVSGCRLLISLASAGIICEELVTSKFALITESVRDEGTSYHYLPPGEKARLSEPLYERVTSEIITGNVPYFTAKSWTTDAPYRETQSSINAMKKRDVACVEMEAAALYAFGQARHKPVICFAHLTNTMARDGEDFEKGDENGSIDSMKLIHCVLSKIGSY